MLEELKQLSQYSGHYERNERNDYRTKLNGHYDAAGMLRAAEAGKPPPGFSFQIIKGSVEKLFNQNTDFPNTQTNLLVRFP